MAGKVVTLYEDKEKTKPIYPQTTSDAVYNGSISLIDQINNLQAQINELKNKKPTITITSQLNMVDQQTYTATGDGIACVSLDVSMFSAGETRNIIVNGTTIKMYCGNPYFFKVTNGSTFKPSGTSTGRLYFIYIS